MQNVVDAGCVFYAECVLVQVKADKTREVKDGHDGTWVAHPALVTVALQIFNEHMKTPNQIYVTREDVQRGATDLLEVLLPPFLIPCVLEMMHTPRPPAAHLLAGITLRALGFQGNGCAAALAQYLVKNLSN